MSVIWVNIGLIFVLISHGTEASYHGQRDSDQCLSNGQPYRTGFHFQPPKNWMNDPNGPMYYMGLYHLFYQYNPFGPLWRKNITWAHSISSDLINWVHLDHALHPIDPFDINGCWSGSTTFLDGKIPAILYTGIDSQNREVQNLALPKNLSDPFLLEWSKSPHNPLMIPTNGLEPAWFRDPTTAWLGPDKIWRVVVGAQIDGKGMAILYKSKDFVKWNRTDNPLHSSAKTKMWECPDFFPVSVNSTNGIDFSDDQDQFNTKHVLKASFNSHDYYILGKYVAKTDEFVVETDFLDVGWDLRLDYGKFYASKAFYDGATQRRILWAWVNESDSDLDSLNKGWSGLQTFPRSVILSKSGRQLIQWPIKEIEKLRSNKVDLQKKLDLKGGSEFEVFGVTASQADVEVTFDVEELKKAELFDPSWVDPQLLCSQKNASVRGEIGPFGLLALASKDLTEQTAIFFRIFKSNEEYIVLMCSDQSRSSLREGLDKTTYGAFVDLDPSKEKITLRSLIDHSIVESFGGEGRTCITARVYPKLAIDEDAHLYAFNYGSKSVKISKLNAWSIKSAQLVSMERGRIPITGQEYNFED
nr:cell wall invertase 4 [Morus alba]